VRADEAGGAGEEDTHGDLLWSFEVDVTLSDVML
jgi:hypothetical protein